MEQYRNKNSAVAAITSNNSLRQSKLSTEARIKQLEESLQAQQYIIEKYRREFGRLKGHIDNIQRVLNSNGQT